MTTDLKTYIETEVLPYSGNVETDGEVFTDLDHFVNWLESSMRVQMPISCENLMTYLMLDNEDIIVKKRNIYLSYAEFDKLPLDLLGTEARGNFHKMLIAVIVLPCDWLNDNEFYFLTDDEFEILKAVNNGR